MHGYGNKRLNWFHNEKNSVSKFYKILKKTCVFLKEKMHTPWERPMPLVSIFCRVSAMH